MIAKTDSTGHEMARLANWEEAITGIKFDWIVAALLVWQVGGLYLDGWAHHHEALDSFFTPWHAVFYSGFLVVASVLVVSFVRNRMRGYSWREAMQPGYGLSLLGVSIFALGGVSDMIWHMLFGIEVNVDALLSPTHLLLALGMALIVSGPLRAAWRRPDAASVHRWAWQFPMLLSLALTLSLFTFFSLFAHPFGESLALPRSGPLAASPIISQSLGVAGILLQTGLLMGMILLIVQRWALRPGALTLVFTLNLTLVSMIHERYQLIPVAILAGIAADLLLRQLKPSQDRPGALRVFAFAVPVILYLLYFLDLVLTTGIPWSIHLWLGSTIMAGIVGILLSYLWAPPRISTDPVEQKDEVS